VYFFIFFIREIFFFWKNIKGINYSQVVHRKQSPTHALQDTNIFFNDMYIYSWDTGGQRNTSSEWGIKVFIYGCVIGLDVETVEGVVTLISVEIGSCLTSTASCLWPCSVKLWILHARLVSRRNPRYLLYIYINKDNTWFWTDFSLLLIIPLNKFVYNNVILLTKSFKKIIIYIIFVILMLKKKINIICYNMKVQYIYVYNLNQNFIKTNAHNLYILTQ